MYSDDQRLNIQVCEDEEKISQFLILRWQEISREAILKRGFFAAALSGGKTPVFFYRRLAQAGKSFSWDRIHLFLADERWVDFTHPDSTYRMLQETLLRKIPIPDGHVHPIPVNTPSPYESAKLYEEELVRFFRLSPGQFPCFDLILLGIGQDGHTASLFPSGSALSDQALASPVILNDKRHDRVTLTLPVINNASDIIFLVTGEDKAPVLRRIIEERDRSLPAVWVYPDRGNLLFLIDRGAGAQLHRHGRT